MGAISAFTAWKRGKNPYLWFFLGAFFGLIGLIFLFFSPKARRAQKAKADPNTIDVTPQLDDTFKHKLWYYLDKANHQVGPMSFEALSKAFREGKVQKTSYVWNDALDEWQHLSEFIKTR